MTGTHGPHLQKLKKILGAVLLVYGIFALLTPFTPGAFLALLGAEYLGIRLLFWERLKAKLSQPPWPVVTIVASILVSLVTAGVFAAVLKDRRGALKPPSSDVVGTSSDVGGTTPPVADTQGLPGARRFPAPTPPDCPTPPPTGETLPAGCLMVGGNLVRVEFARTPEEQASGLGKRARLDVDAGMYFVFSAASPHTFWMKDTRIPLDLIWVREGRVVGVTANVQPEPGVPEERLRRYPSPGPADAVLEMNAGWAAAHGVETGDAVSPVFRETY